MTCDDSAFDGSAAGPDFAYCEVARDIAARIDAGEFARLLPPERDMAQHYGVAYATMRRAMAELRRRGLVITRQSGPGSLPEPSPT